MAKDKDCFSQSESYKFQKANKIACSLVYSLSIDEIMGKYSLKKYKSFSIN